MQKKVVKIYEQK